MVQITRELVRKKSEHNELIIGTMEELSLHQEDIERIDNVQNWCRDLKILLLQSNLISKIENLLKLKRLEYLNLALNNIEVVENLAELESLTKLDLTLNFIGDLLSVESLRSNYNLKELILTGNPCCDFEGYRDFVICALPQLESLDGVDIKHSDRILARKNFETKRRRIVQHQAEYKIKRDEQKVRVQKEKEMEIRENEGLTEDEINERFWKKNSEHCPETRVDMMRQHRKSKTSEGTEVKVKPPRKLFADCGRPYNINEGKIEFTLKEHASHYELDLHVYRFLDTSLIDVDVQPNYVRVEIKKKIFQLALQQEVNLDASTSQRSQTTGKLLIIMPKLSFNGEIQVLKTDVSLIDKPKMKNPLHENERPVVNTKIIEDDVPPLM